MSTKERIPLTKEKKQKIKLIIILAVEFIAILAVLLLIMFAGKKTYTVTFDIDGGTLISGSLEQRVVQGQRATPPNVAKFGHYLRGWSGSFSSVTRDITVKAIWEYETSAGIHYSLPENANYCEIESSHIDIQGDVYIGAYYSELKVLGIQEGAFKNRIGITGVYLLDGMLTIEKEAFEGCENIEKIEMPDTVVRIGSRAFAGCEKITELVLPKDLKYIDQDAFLNCTSLEKVVLPEGLVSIDINAFAGCSNLKEVVIPKSVTRIGYNAFNTPEMIINVYFSEADMPIYSIGWCPEDATIVYEYVEPSEEESEEDGEKDKSHDKNKDKDKDKDKE